MRGNWEGAEQLALAPSQQLQQQQHSSNMIENHQIHPFHSPTTPAWGIPGGIVKEELTDEKNNDSGVSPGDYASNSCSPRSRHSSVNGSLSPGSATSQDSTTAIPPRNYDYSPSGIYSNHTSPLPYPRILSDDPTAQQNDHQPMDLGMHGSSGESEIGQDTLSCPMCSFVTPTRVKFTEHLATHYSAQCGTPDFSKDMTGQPQSQLSPSDDNNRASTPSNGEKSDQELGDTEEPGVRTPRVNSQGKVKTFRCKQCDFVAITKLEFWEHTKGHIKAEKRLTCPKCPFVTEYKHHLEYHLRNHFGSKPFKCDRCPYTCVNKSMLKSHMKSHSNVYQYRCANCTYATKYCHSLKLHLRKYEHAPAMVLNTDGSINPLPIIDVYGTRRGPKAKPSPPKSEISEENAQSQIQSPVIPSSQILPPQVSPVGCHSAINSLSMVNALGSGINPMMAFQYNQLFSSGFPMANHYGIKDDLSEKQLDHLKLNIFAEYAKAVAAERKNVDVSTEVFNFSEMLNDNSAKAKDIETKMFAEEKSSPEPTTDNKVVIPLDLSKPETMSINNNYNNNNNNNNVEDHYQRILESHQDSAIQNVTSIIANSPKTAGTSRRKGKAVKLDRRIVEQDSEDEKEKKVPSGSSLGSSPAPENLKAKEDQKISSNSAEEISKGFTCQYCDLIFRNEVMYTVHMGYHGFNDPYTCNMCGQQCEDKVSLFLHISRSSH